MSKKMEHSKTITATELKMNLGQYLDYVSDNNEVVVTKNGEKTVRMTPYLSDYDRYKLMETREIALDYLYEGKKVSYEEFMDISEKSELRMEFIDGEIILLSSPSFNHQRILGDLHVTLREFLKGDKCQVVLAPFDVHFFKPDIKDPDVCQPDLVIACDLEEKVNERGRYMGTPDLVVEILSPSTRSKDMVKKLNTYMLSGIKEFWVVDPEKNIILVYTFKDLAIDSYNLYKDEDKAQSLVFDGLMISPAEVFTYSSL